MSRTDRLLVVDAEQRVRDFFAEIASLSNFVVAKATDVHEMQRRLSYFDPTVVLLGLDRKLTTTAEKLKLLRETDCNARILLMSALPDQDVVAAENIGMILGLDMSGIVPRPVSVVQVREQLEALRKPSSADELGGGR